MIEVNHECYVSFEVAELLKEAGFDWKVRYMYRNNNPTLCICTEAPYRNMPKSNKCPMSWQYAAPTLDVAQRWLREVKSFEICVGFTKHDFGNGNEKAYFYSCYEVPENEDAHEYSEDKYYHFYEEAQEAGEKKALKLILEKGGGE